jgi:hypothetical protein
MGANIYYEPLKRKKQSVRAGARSSFYTTLERVFGSREPQLSASDVPKLEALRDAGDEKDGWQDLIDGIERFDEIQVSVEF